MNANTRQVGGAHYKSTYQHWDLVCNIGLNYLEGQITKYIYRWRGKNGIEDLKKSEHFLQKLIDTAPLAIMQRPAIRNSVFAEEQVELFIRINEIPITEAAIIRIIVGWPAVGALHTAQRNLKKFIQDEELGHNSDA